MSGGGSQTTTSSTTVPPQFLNAYQNTVSRAQNVASKPYQAYTGNLVAGFTPQQTQAQGQVSALQGQYQPELNAAQSSINASTTPLWSGTIQSGVAPGSGIAGYTPNFTANNPGVNASTIAQYENPFQSQVIGSTEAQIANTDAQQQAQLSGNAASAGAFGGDRMGVAQGILGGQQALANNSTLAGLNTTNYNTALQTAEQQQATGIAAQEAATQMGNQEFNTEQGAQLGANEANAWLNSQAGYADANLANEGNQLGLTDASALAQSGLTQQQQAQAGLNTAYEQWQAQQAFPYQQTGWLANITEGIGSNVGGTSTTSTSQSKDGGRIWRAAGGIVPHGYAFGGSAPTVIDQFANQFDPYASAGAISFLNDTPLGWALNLIDPPKGQTQVQPVNTHFAQGGRAHYDNGGSISILGDTPDPANSWIPSASGGGGGGIGRGPPSPSGAPPMQQSPLSNPATDISALSGGASLYNNLGGPQLIGSNGIIAGPVSGWGTALFGGYGSAPSAAMSADGTTQLGSSVIGGLSSPAPASLGAYTPGLFSSPGSIDLASTTIPQAAGSTVTDALSPTTAAVSDASPGFMSMVGDTIATGASDIGSGLSAAGSAIGSAADVVGNGIAAGAGALASGASWLGDAILALFALKDGGRVGDEPQHKAGGGIVIPFPEHRIHRASGGIAAGNHGEMPYSMAPPVPLQATGTTGMAPTSFMPPSAAPLSPSGGTLAFGGGIGSGHGGVMPYGGSTAFRRGGGIVPRFAGGGPTNPLLGDLPGDGAGSLANYGSDAPVANDDEWSGAGAAPSADQTAAWDAAPTSTATTSGPGIASGPSYTPEKPNLWMPAIAGIASAVLGRHTNAGRNIAEGVLAGLGTYQNEDKQYQEGQQKAVSLDQEAKRIVDDALWHKEQLSIDQANSDSEIGLRNLQGQKENLDISAQRSIQRQLNPPAGSQPSAGGSSSGSGASGMLDNAVNSIPDAQAQNAAMKAAMAAGLSPDAAAAWISTVHNESGWNLQAKDGAAGEIGPGQVKPDTGKSLGYTPDQLRDPQINLIASAQYFKKQWDAGNNDPGRAMAGYNTGSPNKPDDAYVKAGLTRLQQWGGEAGQSGSAMNLADLTRTANLYLRSGDPRYIAVGKELLQQVQEITKNGTTVDRSGNVIAIPGSNDAAAARAGAVAKAQSDAELQNKILESLSNRAAEPLRLGPNESAVSGFDLLPPELQQQIKRPSQGNSLPTQTLLPSGIAAQPQQSQRPTASFQPSAPPTRGVPVVTQPPPDLPASSQLSPSTLIKNPDGSITNSVNNFSQASASAQGKDIGAIPQHLETLGNTRTQLVAIRDELLQNAQSPGFVQQGWGAGTRTTLAKAANAASASFGGGPVFDPTSVGNNESFIKNSNVAAFTLARTMSGGRVALGEVLQANQSVPNINNSFYGNSVVSNLLLQDNIRQTDRLRYQAQQAERGVSPTAAGDMFDRTNPPDRYVMAAMATAVKDYAPNAVATLLQHPTPVQIASFDKRYGQGTAQTLIAGAQ